MTMKTTEVLQQKKYIEKLTVVSKKNNILREEI